MFVGTEFLGKIYVIKIGKVLAAPEMGSLHHVPKSLCLSLKAHEKFGWELPATTSFVPSLSSPPLQVYGIFYATSFLELYRSPHNATTTSHNITVIVQRDEQYLFLVGCVSGPSPTRATGRSPVPKPEGTLLTAGPSLRGPCDVSLPRATV